MSANHQNTAWSDYSAHTGQNISLLRLIEISEYEISAQYQIKHTVRLCNTHILLHKTRAAAVLGLKTKKRMVLIEGLLLPEDERTIPHIQLHSMVDSGELKESDINDLGKVAAGIATVDRNSGRKKYFISNGMIIQDIAWGMTMYESAVEKGLGQELVMWDEPYMI